MSCHTGQTTLQVDVQSTSLDWPQNSSDDEKDKLQRHLEVQGFQGQEGCVANGSTSYIAKLGVKYIGSLLAMLTSRIGSAVQEASSTQHGNCFHGYMGPV